MKALKYGFGLILVGGFALTASCGGSSDDSSSPSGGTSSSTGGTSSSTGGTLSTGGTVTGGGNTTGNPTGGTIGTTGGTVGTTGGTVGTTGGTGPAGGAGGGATMNPAGCPATAPAVPARGMPGETCTPLANRRDTCSYVTGTMTETCTCNVPFMGPGGGQAGAATTEGTFQCITRATPIACPAMPATGDVCSGPCRPAGSRRTCACTNGALVCPVVMGAAGAAG